MTFSFETPYLPPSVNSQYVRTSSGFVALTSEAREWRKMFALTFGRWMKRNDLVKYRKPNHVKLGLTLHLVRDRDLDNFPKSILDALEGVLYDNDRQVVELHMSKFKVNTRPALFVTIL